MYPAISLDGFIAKLDGDSYSWVNPADEDRYRKAVERCGCIVTGRKTFEEYREDFDNYVKKQITVFVCTSNKNVRDEAHIKYLNGTAGEMADKIKNNYPFVELIVCGGGQINGLFASAGLVDEIIISIQPCVLGEGIPLFGSYKPNLKLQLLATNQDIEGVTQNSYKLLHK